MSAHKIISKSIRSSSLHSQEALRSSIGNNQSPIIRAKSHCRNSPPKPRNPNVDNRIVINVKGKKFETYIDTLNTYPDTLLGSEKRREKYFDPFTGEIMLAGDQSIFEAVLFYYQSKGILAKPAWISEKDFERELIFYEIVKKPVKKPRPTRNKFLRRTWNMMEYPRSSVYALLLAIISILAITLSLIIFCLETVPCIVKLPDPEKSDYNKYILSSIERSTMVWFTMEYTLRIISSPARLKFVTSFLGVVDVVVLIPFYIDLARNPKSEISGFYVIRIMRMVRVFRIFKLTRYSTGLKVLGKTIVESCGQLLALSLCLFLSAVIFSSVIYYLEYPHYTGDPIRFPSIPDTCWYVLITMSTVGYGDVIPHTILGKLMAAFCMITGIIVLLCLPTPVFITHFGRFYEDVVNRKSAVEDEEINDDDERDITDRALLVPTWFNDDGWKERIRNDTRMTLFMPAINVYLSNQNIKKAASMELVYEDADGCQ